MQPAQNNLNPIPANRSTTDTEITDHVLEKGRRHVNVIVCAPSAAVHHSGNLRLFGVRRVC